MLHKAHAELPFLLCAMIKLLQRFLSTLKPTSSHLEQTRDCVGVHKMFAVASLNAFPTLLLSFPIFILCQTSVLTTVSQFSPLTIWEGSLFSLYQHTFVFTVPAHLLESLGSGNYGSDWILLFICHKTTPPVPWQPWLLLRRGTAPC